MSEMTLIVPNDWVTQDKLVEITGLRPGTIEAARKSPGWLGANIFTLHQTVIQKKTANACTTERLSTSGLRACQRNSRVRANEDPFMLSGLLDVRRE